MMILVIDNRDSFVHNLARYVQRLGYDTQVVPEPHATVAELRRLRPEAIVLSPGPGRPEDTPAAVEVVRQLGTSLPMLGVCLGHQQIAYAYGGMIETAEPVHGRTSTIYHDQRAEFANLGCPFEAARYHSLVVQRRSLPDKLVVTARTSDDTIMGIRAVEHPVFGWQFHPESILTEVGYELLLGFFSCIGLSRSAEPPAFATELQQSDRDDQRVDKKHPVTF